MKESTFNKLIQPIRSDVYFNLLTTQDFDGTTYVAIYFGKAKDLYDRLYNWHINQKHSQAVVTSGYLSTLRQTITALLEMSASKSETAVNKVLDDCIIEWEETENPEAEEHTQLTEFYYPLNIQDNPKKSEKLTDLRSQYAKVW